MAIPKTASVEVKTDKLRTLLTRAREVKKVSTIDPPLPMSEIVGPDGTLLGDVVGDKEIHKAAVEGAARRIFYEIISSTRISDPSFIEAWNMLDILHHCGDRGQCYPGLPLLLVEELLDSLGIDGCRKTFDFLESRREAWIAKNFKSVKDLVILRLCNELLRRLSRVEDAEFCGRVFVFLFQSFPLGDKSSVNARGEFHTDNVTSFEQTHPSAMEDVDKEQSQVENDQMEGVKVTGTDDVAQVQDEDSTKDTSKPKPLSIDDLYPIFWSLQHDFSDPPRLFIKENLDDFKTRLESTLSKFREVPKVIQSKTSDGKRLLKRKQEEGQDDSNSFSTTFNPKYLTSRDLFKLELSDLAFQRHILVQALIILDFLLSLTEKSRKRLDKLSQKALQYDFILSEQDAAWALGIKNSIANYLQEGPEGKFYYRMVDTVLSRDKNWVRWKMENCQPIQRGSLATVEFLDAKSGAQKASASKRLRAAPMGSLDLAFLSDDGGVSGLDRLKRPDRNIIPELEGLHREIEGDDLDMEMASTAEEKQTLLDAKAAKTWRLLRIAVKDKLSLFDKIDDGRNLHILFQPEDAAEGANSSISNHASEASPSRAATEGGTVFSDAAGDGDGDGEGAMVDSDVNATATTNANGVGENTAGSGIGANVDASTIAGPGTSTTTTTATTMATANEGEVSTGPNNAE